MKRSTREFLIPVNQDYTGIYEGGVYQDWMNPADYIHVMEVVPINWENIWVSYLAECWPGVNGIVESEKFLLIKRLIEQQLAGDS
jgi:hypothetical protein